eukprot:c20011_g1_i1 orf=155-439(+)
MEELKVSRMRSHLYLEVLQLRSLMQAHQSLKTNKTLPIAVPKHYCHSFSHAAGSKDGFAYKQGAHKSCTFSSDRTSPVIEFFHMIVTFSVTTLS